MFELTLCVSFERQKYISKFYKTMLSSVRNDSGIIIKHNSEGKSYLSIAVSDEKKEYIKSKALDFVLEVIQKEFKYNYFKDNLNIVEKNSLTEAFLNAITCFDEEIDKEEIKKKINFSGEIVIESLFYFKLQELVSRWRKTVEIINHNLIMNSDPMMCEVLRYLCAVSENNSVFVDLKFSNKQIILKNFVCNKKFKKTEEGVSSLFAEIIRLNPTKINITESENNSDFGEITSTLLKVFNDKIYFV